MTKLNKVSYGGKEYTVNFEQTPNWSHTTMKKKGLVYHVTTSNSFKGTLSWFRNPSAGASALFVIGLNVGEITQMATTEQMQWHAGNISNPNERFKALAVADTNRSSGYVNPNLYLDGIEFSGGVDKDKSGKVDRDEVHLTEWQFTCAEQIAKWHSKVCGYALTPETQIIHQDIASYKPDLSDVLDEIKFRLFKKSDTDKVKEEELQELQTRLSLLQMLLKLWTQFNLLKK